MRPGKSLFPLLLVVLLIFGYWNFRKSNATQNKTREAPSNIIFITVDTLRFDHTPFGNYSRPTMPATSEFFKDGINFVRAETVRTVTTPAYASMLTGVYPYRHGVRNLYTPLHKDVRTLQERLKEKGYLTAAFVSSFVMMGRFSGLNQGFDTYDDLVLEREVTRDNYERTAGNTVKHVLKWLSKVPRDKPFFLFLHFIDPHSPYQPPGVYANHFTSQKELILKRENIPDNVFIEPVLNQHQYVDWYDGEIAFLDSQLKELYASFENSKLFENSWFLFTADHGESFGEREIYFRHGSRCYEAQSRIPMVWLPPASLRSNYSMGRRDQVVSVIDVVPTALDALGFKEDGSFDGTSLLPAMYDAFQQSEIRFIERVVGTKREYAAVSQRYKFYKRFDQDQATIELYDVITDPGETTNLAQSIPVPSQLSMALDSYIAASDAFKLPFATEPIQADARKKYVKEHAEGFATELTEEDLEKLKALGYAQ